MRHLAAGLFLGLGLGACGPAQVIVFVDTDALTPEAVANDPSLSADAIIDTLRVDLLSEKGASLDVCEFSLATLDAWPLSFGVRAIGTNNVARLRLRGFRQRLALTEQLPDASSYCGRKLLPGEPAHVSLPPPEATIDRVIEAEMPSAGPRYLGVTLRLRCMGQRPSFIDRTTCIDSFQRAAPFDTELPERSGQDEISVVGSARPAIAKTCSRDRKTLRDPNGTNIAAMCVPGGFSILGQRISGDPAELSPWPLRAVEVAPFYMDAKEFSNKRLKAMLDAGVKVTLPQARIKDPLDPRYADFGDCTWDPTDASQDELPVNCVLYKTAVDLCRAVGGFLPSEAQWMHEALGRGERRFYPWGDGLPSCCSASLSRPSVTISSGRLCKTDAMGAAVHGPAAVGTFDGRDCDGRGDISRDGIYDMGGNVLEMLRDRFTPFAAGCGLMGGVTQDPVCNVSPEEIYVIAGSAWVGGPFSGASVGRNKYFANFVDVNTGFRCAYTGISP